MSWRTGQLRLTFKSRNVSVSHRKIQLTKEAAGQRNQRGWQVRRWNIQQQTGIVVCSKRCYFNSFVLASVPHLEYGSSIDTGPSASHKSGFVHGNKMCVMPVICSCLHSSISDHRSAKLFKVTKRSQEAASKQLLWLFAHGMSQYSQQTVHGVDIKYCRRLEGTLMVSWIPQLQVTILRSNTVRYSGGVQWPEASRLCTH